MKRILAILVMLSVLTGCGTKQSNQPDDWSFTETIYASQISSEDCYLCGSGMDDTFSYWGQNNVALISLNTFEIAPFEINRYDIFDGHLIEEVTKTIIFRYFGDKNSDFSAVFTLNTDRGYATGTVTLHDNIMLDVDKVASFLCSDCMNEVLPKRTDCCYSVGLIDLQTKQVRLFEEPIIGFNLGDFYIERQEVEADTDSYRMRLLVFYCPVRYEEPS